MTISAGDLKTYLLSRRELVGLDTKEAEDISAASLTKMALDVIEGLNYLHSKEYIHRDIACRNCLVSSSRTVKIGDFGMTRRVYDDGSYVFTRRGELPFIVLFYILSFSQYSLYSLFVIGCSVSAV